MEPGRPPTFVNDITSIASPARGPGFSAAKARSRGAPTRGTRSVVSRSVVDRSAGSDLTQHATLSSQICREALSLFDSYGPAPGKGLSVKQLRALLQDMGLSYTENHVRDLITRVRQTASVIKRNTQEAEKRAAAEEEALRLAEGGGETPLSDSGFGQPEGARALSVVTGTTALTSATSGGERDKPAYLDRRGFLEVLTLTLQDSDPEQELRSAWGALDADGDGVLSVSDMTAALAELGMPPQRAEELAESLNQADFDNDGSVTFADFCKAMDTN
eukprot:Hpha_TRINITY_DN3580_c0_g1::TRINITY_DN3580_c0_g1_i1::g.25556::m.25556